MKNTNILVIGAGLTGLSCAHHLSKQNADFLVIEKRKNAGGVIGTEGENGFLYETGPNTGVIGHPEVAELFEDLGDKVSVEIANKNVNKRYILKNGVWEALPGSLKGGITTTLFTLKDKIRLLGEPFRKPGTDPNETLADMVKRRMGKSFLNYAIDPFILGVYAGDPAQLVPRFALPKLYDLEQDYGSFIGGAIKKKMQKKDPALEKATREIFSVKGGFKNLINALLEDAGKEKFLFDQEPVSIEKNNDGYLVKVVDSQGEVQEIQTKKIISTVGAYNIRKLYPFIGDTHLNNIEKLHYTKVIEVAVGFNRWEGMDLDGFGALIPHSEKRDLLGIMFMSSLFKDRAPKGGALLTLFMGGVRRQDLIEKNDKEIKEIVSTELKDLFKLKEFKPDLLKLIRHSKAIPQYRADSEERFESIVAVQNQFPGIILGGNIRDGIGMADRIKQGKMLANA